MHSGTAAAEQPPSPLKGEGWGEVRPLNLNTQLLQQHFDTLAETPEAREKIQQLVLDFAVRGRLTQQNPKEGAFDLEAAQSVNDPDLKPPPPEEQPFAIPQNWIWGRFGQVFNIEGGTQPPKDQFVASPRDGYIHLLQFRPILEPVL
jgi:hypothetical protein